MMMIMKNLNDIADVPVVNKINFLLMMSIHCQEISYEN